MIPLKKLVPKSKTLYLLIILFLFQSCNAQDKKNEKDIDEIQKNAKGYVNKISFSNNVDFKLAAKIATPGVVHVKCLFKTEIKKQDRNEDEFYNLPNPFKDFFGEDPLLKHFKFRDQRSQEYDSEPIIGSGSGVILTPDGYIVTNNHMVKDAEEINITLYNGRSYIAKIIGTDPQTDLALLKIDGENLPFIMFGDSDVLEVGEWVIAVGNPFNLASTVTAGIVSAKARNINILKNQGAIESFIQTDAVMNPGNSGGALVTLDGKLVGINTAIATPTGSYAGYAFAIPVDIVKKVSNDLMNYGAVQRGFLGISIRDMNSEIANEIKSDRANGVYVDSVTTTGAAREAGVMAKDIIISVDNIETISSAKLQEIVLRKHPGDKVKIVLIRNGKEKKEFTATLKKQELPIRIIKTENTQLFKDLGIELVEINKEDQNKYRLKKGLKITKLYNGKIKQFTNIKEGFVITAVNNREVSSIKSFIDAIETQTGGIMFEGKYAGDSTLYYYAFGM